MPWLILDIAIPLVALALLARGGLSLWRRAKRLSAEVAKASDAVAAANDSLAVAQASSPRRR